MGDTLTPQNQPRGHTIATLRAALDDLEAHHGCDRHDVILVCAPSDQGHLRPMTRVQVRGSQTINGPRAIILYP